MKRSDLYRGQVVYDKKKRNKKNDGAHARGVHARLGHGDVARADDELGGVEWAYRPFDDADLETFP